MCTLPNARCLRRSSISRWEPDTSSYTFCNGEVFDPDETPSTVGIMTEQFRKSPGVKRSDDGIFSIAVLGSDQDYFIDVGRDCFGAQSVFEKLYDRNAWLVFIGETFDMTYIHFIEQRLRVPYRSKKRFSGVIRKGCCLINAVFEYNVRPLDQGIHYDLEKIARYLEDAGLLRISALGHSKIRAVHCVDAFNLLSAALRKDIYFFLKAPLR